MSEYRTGKLSDETIEKIRTIAKKEGLAPNSSKAKLYNLEARTKILEFLVDSYLSKGRKVDQEKFDLLKGKTSTEMVAILLKKKITGGARFRVETACREIMEINDKAENWYEKVVMSARLLRNYFKGQADLHGNVRQDNLTTRHHNRESRGTSLETCIAQKAQPEGLAEKKPTQNQQEVGTR